MARACEDICIALFAIGLASLNTGSSCQMRMKLDKCRVVTWYLNHAIGCDGSFEAVSTMRDGPARDGDMKGRESYIRAN